jgi:hypothetical protein
VAFEYLLQKLKSKIQLFKNNAEMIYGILSGPPVIVVRRSSGGQNAYPRIGTACQPDGQPVGIRHPAAELSAALQSDATHYVRLK